MLVFLKALERFGKRHNRLRYYALIFIPNFCYHLNSRHNRLKPIKRNSIIHDRIPAGRNFISSLLLAIFIILAVVLMSKTLYTYAGVNEGSATSHNHRYSAARILQ